MNSPLQQIRGILNLGTKEDPNIALHEIKVTARKVRAGLGLG